MEGEEYVQNLFEAFPNDDDIGEDWEDEPYDEEEPLMKYQYQALNSELLRNVEVENLLGEGSYGKVFRVIADYRANQNTPEWTQFRFAMKVCRLVAPAQNFVHESLADMRALRLLRHPNICNIAEIIGIPDRVTRFPYSVTCTFFELCDGDLQSLIQVSTSPKPNKLSSNLNRHWVRQILEAIQYIHSEDCCHRDVNTGNILYRRGSHAQANFQTIFLLSTFKLADFGRARHRQHDQSYAYTEQYYFEDTLSDIKSVANILYLIGDQNDEQMHGFCTDITNGDFQMETLLQHPWFDEEDEPPVLPNPDEEPTIAPPYYDYYS